MQAIKDLRSLTSNRPLSALVVASAISSFGDWLYLAALPILVFQTTQDPALVGLVAAGRLLPFLALSVPAGLLADRYDRRHILIVCESSRCVLMLAMTAAHVAHGDIRVLIALAMVAAAFGTFSIPAQSALMPQLAADPEELAMANASSATLDNLGSIAGPILAGVLAVTAGLSIACLINGMTFALVVILVLLARPPEVRPRIEGGVREEPIGHRGWIAIARMIARPLALDASISFAAGALGVLPVLIAVDQLGTGEAFAGVLGGAAGAGAVVGGIAAGVLSTRRSRLGRTVGILALAISLAVLSIVTVPGLAVVALGAAMASLVLVDTLNVTRLQQAVPGQFLGRALGLLNTSAAIWLMAGSALPPIVAVRAGTDSSLLVTAAVVLGLGLLSAATVPLRLRATKARAAQAASA